MAKLTTAEFIEAIKELSVLELNELVKACEEEFGVSAAAGVVVAAAGAGEAAEEKTEFDVELTEVGPNKVKVIIVALQNNGGAIGNMVCVNNVVSACATTGTIGNEGKIIRTDFLPCIVYCVIVIVVSLIVISLGGATVLGA